jgi:hypothetical protein
MSQTSSSILSTVRVSACDYRAIITEVHSLRGRGPWKRGIRFSEAWWFDFCVPPRGCAEDAEDTVVKRLELEETTEDRIASILKVLVIIAALMTLPLTAAFWFEWDHWAFTYLDWTVWSIFVVEYMFYMAISNDRWDTTRKMWLSVVVVVFSFPLLHELLKASRLIRLVRPVPLLRQSVVLRQVELSRLSHARSAGVNTGWDEAKDRLGDDHPVTRRMVYFERLKAWAIRRVTGAFRRESSSE